MLAIWLLLTEVLVQSADTLRIRFYQLVVALVGVLKAFTESTDSLANSIHKV